jgi:pimeloyl-ACP methyl ester carboxylesterase
MLTALLPLLLACLPSQGPFALGRISVAWPDPARNNQIVTAEIWYPADSAGVGVPLAAGATELPVIGFGHGFQMPASAYGYLWEALVPRGYVFAAATTGGELFPNHASFAADLRFLVEELRRLDQTPGSLFNGKLSDQAALIGHSMGGGAAVLAAKDAPSIQALVTLAAADTNPSSVAAATGVIQRALTLSGSADCVVPPSTQASLHQNLASPCRWRATLTGGNHCFFASSASLCELGQLFCPGSLSRASQNALTLSLLTPWLDTHLKGQGSAWANFLTNANQPQVNDWPGCSLSPQVTQPVGTAAASAGHVLLSGVNLGLVLSATQRLPLPGGGLSAPQAATIVAQSTSSLTLSVAASNPGFAELSLSHPEGVLLVPALPRFPALAAGPAQLGQTLSLVLHSDAPGSLLLAFGLLPIAPLPIPPLLHGLELADPTLLLTTGLPAGLAPFSLPLPSNPALTGLQVHLQALAASASAPSFTNRETRSLMAP